MEQHQRDEQTAAATAAMVSAAVRRVTCKDERSLATAMRRSR